MPLVDFSTIDSRVLLGGGIAILVLLWLLWAIAKKIVRLGYFVLSFTLGLAVAYGASQVYGKPQPVTMLIGEAFAFAWVWSLIRSKAARAVTAVAVVVMLRFGSGYLPFLAGAPSPPDKVPTSVGKKPQTKPGKVRRGQPKASPGS